MNDLKNCCDYPYIIFELTEFNLPALTCLNCDTFCIFEWCLPMNTMIERFNLKLEERTNEPIH